MDRLTDKEIKVFEEALSIIASDPIEVTCDYENEVVHCLNARSNHDIAINCAMDSRSAMLLDCVKNVFSQTR